MGAAMPAGGERRTQKDRSETTQLKVLEAALECIGRDGYVAVSLQDIADAAGISRGAITHHYASKADLTAAAMDHFFSERYIRFKHSVETQGELSLSERLDIIDRDMEDLSAVGFEMLVALRSDPVLRKKYIELARLRLDDMRETYINLFPEFSEKGRPGLMSRLAMNFYRGLFVDRMHGNTERIDEMKALFKDMIRIYVTPEPPRQGHLKPVSRDLPG